MDLDPVDTHFYLFVNFSDDLIGSMDDSGVAAGALIGQEPGRRTTHTVDQHVAARGHARPFNNTPLNRVAQVYPYIEHAVRVEETGETRSKYFLGVDPGDQCGKAVPPMKKQFVITVWLIKADMAVAVDHAGEHTAAGSIDLLNHDAVGAACSRLLAYSNNTFVMHQHVPCERVVPGAIDDEPVFDEDVRLTHSGCSLPSAAGWKSV